MFLISEECAFRGETLPDIVNRIADAVQERADKGKNFGSVLIPEGLLQHISAYKHLIDELNELFAGCSSNEEKHACADKCVKDESYIKEILTPWSYSLYCTLPEFMRVQLINEQEISG